MAENKDKKVLNVPNLRFPEFEGEWEESTIEKQFELYSGNTPSRINKELFNGTINWISSGELKEHYIYSTKERISQEAANNLKLLSVGTFVIAIYGLEAEGVRGTGSIIQEPSTISQACMAFTPKGEITNEFLYSWYKKHGHVIGVKYAQGTKQQNLSYDILEKFKISYPNVKEQDKLNLFFSLLDKRISTQNKIIEELKQLKNGISLNLFTNRIIFDKQITLSKCGTLRNGYAFKSSTYNLKGKYSIITIANVTGSRFIESVDCNKVTQIPEDIQSHQILSNGDILISLTGNVGRVSLCTDGHFLLNQRVGLFELSDSIDKEFIYQVLSSKHFENEMIAKGQGAAQMNINKNDVESYVIPYSTNLQNIRIVSSLLKSLDEKILTMEHLLLSYNKQKTYLLRQMFI